MILRDKLEINTEELGSRLPKLIALFTYSNPEFHQKKAMHVSTKGISPTLYHYNLEVRDGRRILVLPRGSLKKVISFYKENKIPFRIKDESTVSMELIDWKLRKTTLEGKELIVSEQQNLIVDTLTTNEGGLIEASPGGGKTVAMLSLIGRLRQPTLILVHEHRLRKQWEAEIEDKVEGNFILGRYDGDVKKDGDVVVAIINTVYNMYNEDNTFFDKFGCVIVDECLSPDTRITTPNGIQLLEDLKIGDYVLTPSGKARIKNKWYSKKQAYQYTTTKGNSITASSNHLMLTYKSSNFEASSGYVTKEISNCGSLLFSRKLNSERIIPEFNLLNYLFGWFLGDGTNDNGYIKFAFRKKTVYFREIFNKYSIFREFTNSRGDTIFSLDNTISKKLIETFNIKSGKKDISYRIPDFIYKSADPSFLKGIFDSDGSRSYNSGKLKQNKIELNLVLKYCIYQIADMLRSYNIYNTITVIERKNIKHNDMYRININGEYVAAFNNIIKFNVSYKNKTSTNYRNIGVNTKYTSTKIRETIPLGEMELIDIELDDDEHLFYANGFVSHNCHHVPSSMFNLVINNTPAKYRVGVTGTVERKDGLHLLIYDMIGETLISIEEKDLKDRITSFEFQMVNTNVEIDLPVKKVWTGSKKEKQYDYTKSIGILTDNKDRNQLILNSVIGSIKDGYFPLVLSERVEHCKYLYEYIQDLGYKSVLLIGDTRKKTKWEEIRKDKTIQCVVAIDKIASEGLDYPELSALHVTCPTVNFPKLKQRVARIRRFLQGKVTPKVYDYVDNLVYYSKIDNKTGKNKKRFPLKDKGYARLKYYKQLQQDYELG